MSAGRAAISRPQNARPSRTRDLLELSLGYALILAVIWTPRPWQRPLYLAAAIFLGYIIVKSIQEEPSGQRWSLVGIVAVGVVMMAYARFGLKSSFFQVPRESADRVVKES